MIRGLSIKARVKEVVNDVKRLFIIAHRLLVNVDDPRKIFFTQGIGTAR